MTTKKTDNKLTVKQAAEMLGVSAKTVYKMARRGMIRFYEKPFGMPRITVDRSDVERLAASAST